MTLKLFGYWRSSSTYRVRIALELKSLDYEYVPVNLLERENKAPAHLDRNPSGKVPALATDDGFVLSESVAITQFLEDTVPAPSLLPKEPKKKARVIEVCEVINSGIQPLQNNVVLSSIERIGGKKKQWAKDAISAGLAVVEELHTRHQQGQFFAGDDPGLSECFLIPQLYNARRYGIDVSTFEHLNAIAKTCENLPAFVRAHPDNQSDAKN